MNQLPALPVPRLRRVLLANSVFSASSGAVMLIASPHIAAFMGIGSPIPFILIGMNLLVFASGVIFVASRPTIDSTFVRLIIALDLLWVVGSVVILLTNAFALTQEGSIVVAFVGLLVLGFVVGQVMGLQQVTQE